MKFDYNVWMGRFKEKFTVTHLEWLLKNKPMVFFMIAYFAVVVVIITWGYFTYGVGRTFNAVGLLGVVLVFFPVTIIQYLKGVRIKDMEKYFPNFLRDIADSRRAGVTLPNAIKTATNVDYGALTPEIKKMSDQLSWGVPFEQVMLRFRDRTPSWLIRRNIDMILQAYHAGGPIADVLDAVTADTIKIKEIEEETHSTLKIQINTIYVLFFTFVGVIVMLEVILFPALPAMKGLSGLLTGGQAESIPPTTMQMYLLHFVFIQGFFIGLLAGEVVEGNIKAGFKHSLFLMIMGFAILQVFVQPPSVASRIVSTIAATPLDFETLTELGAYETSQSFSVTTIVAELQKIARDDPARKYLDRVTTDDITFEQIPSCKNCGRDTIYVSDNGKSVVVVSPAIINYRMQNKRGKIIITLQ